MRNKKRTLLLLIVAGCLSMSGACTKKSASDALLHADEHFTFPPGFPPDPGPAEGRLSKESTPIATD